MTAHFTAVVEQGRLRPTTPVELPEGAELEVYVVAPQATPPGRSPALILAAIAALPSTPVDPTTSDLHDQVLYRREAHP
jgi:Protein of unknown function DUF104